MNNKPIIIIAGEPYSVFLEIFFKTLKSKDIKLIKSPIIIIASKENLIKQMKKLNFFFKIRLVDRELLNIKSINNNSINDGDLQGRPYVGAAGSFQGLYIGNGMVVNDNQLNGDHYIGTAFGGMMAGPVTVNGVLTVDGNYVVV